ncbi:hypothetical protein [Leisingera sp. JC11]|uniref:CBU_0592 family membrane protein n=1 Tax=Leisingera sp. JC11 TaxID=3042469 RepID=UPI003451BB36
MIAEIAWFDARGLAGSVIIFAACYLATRSALPADKIPFHAANIAGGALVMLSLVFRPQPRRPRDRGDVSSDCAAGNFSEPSGQSLMLRPVQHGSG